MAHAASKRSEGAGAASQGAAARQPLNADPHYSTSDIQHSTSSSPPNPQSPIPNPQSLWPALLDRLSDRPWAGWLRFLRLDRVQGDTAIVHILPGHREVKAIATPARLEPVARELSTLTGQPMRIVLETAHAAPEERSDEGAGHSHAAPEERSDEGAGNPPSAPSGALDRRSAMRVPLVRQALEFFPDAMVIDAHEEDVSNP